MNTCHPATDVAISIIGGGSTSCDSPIATSNFHGNGSGKPPSPVHDVSPSSG